MTRRPQNRALAALFVLLVGLGSWTCDDHKGQALTTSPSSAVSLAVTGGALTVGMTTQFTATATLSNGSTQNVTSTAAWSSSNPAVATVTSGGAVTGVSVGDAVITATYSGISGNAPVSLTRSTPIVVSGVVTDGFSGGILPNILVHAVDSANVTKEVRTDASGSYAVGELAAGTLTVSFSGSSYITVTKTITALADARVDATLQRSGPFSGPAVLTVHTSLEVPSLTCQPSARGYEFRLPGMLTVDAEHVTWTMVSRSKFATPLTMKLIRSGERLAGQIGGEGNFFKNPTDQYDYYIEITDRPENAFVGNPRFVTAGGLIETSGRASGVFIGTLYVQQINPYFRCASTYQWSLTNQ